MDTVGIDKKASSFKTTAEFKEFIESLPDEKFKEYYTKTNAELTDFENVMKNGVTKTYESKTIDIRNILNDRRPEQLNTTRVLTMAEGGLVNA
jgi:IS1 family transposase